MKNTLFLLVTICLMASCSSSIEQKIGEKIDACKSANCTVSFREVTDFKWDKVYVFNHPQSWETINTIIGTRYENYSEFSRPLIFMNGKFIVYSENNPWSSDELYNPRQLWFSFPDSLSSQVYTNRNAVFQAFKDTLDEGDHYFRLVHK